LRPLLEKCEELEDLLLHHRDMLAQNTGVPFVRLVYAPHEEIECRRQAELLQRTLEAKNVSVQVVSCRGVIFEHYENRGLLDELFQLEGPEDERLAANISRHAREALLDRLMEAAKKLVGDGVLLLVDVAFTYPHLRLAPVLEDCVNEIKPPMALVVFYPCDVDTDGQLLFLGVRPSGYYRTRDLV
jgi:hypothetical protein